MTQPPRRAVKLETSGPEGRRRCPLCREEAGRYDALQAASRPGLRSSWVACDVCGTPYHEACASEFGVCATLGCERAAGLVFPRLEPSPRIRDAGDALWLPRAARIGWAILMAFGLGFSLLSAETLNLLVQGLLSLGGFLLCVPLLLLTLLILLTIPPAVMDALAREVIHLQPDGVRIETHVLRWSCSYHVPRERIARCLVALTKSAEWKVLLVDSEDRSLRKFAYRSLSLEEALFVAQRVEEHVRGLRPPREPRVEEPPCKDRAQPA